MVDVKALLIELESDDIGLPTISLCPEGVDPGDYSLCLDWDIDRHNIFSINLMDNGSMYYAMLFNGEHYHGVTSLDDHKGLAEIKKLLEKMYNEYNNR